MTQIEQIQALRLQLDNLARSCEVSSSFSDNLIAGDDTKENPMCQVYGPYKDRKGFRIKVIDTETGKSKSQVFDTLELAQAGINKAKREYQRSVGVTVEKAIAEYTTYLQAKDSKARYIETTVGRLRVVFSDPNILTGDLDCNQCWQGYEAALGANGKPRSIDTRKNTLNQSKTFLRWLLKKGYIKDAKGLDTIEILGKRKKGKPKFQSVKDDSRKFLAKCMQLADLGDTGAVACMMGLYMGLRASEVTDRLVGDVDNNGTELVIREAKTEAGNRRVGVPMVLRPYLKRLAEGKAGTSQLLGPVTRHWALRAVQRICRAIGLKVVGFHSLRGMAAELAVGTGMMGDAIAASMGHESFAITQACYAGNEAVNQASVNRVARALDTEQAA